MNEKISTMTAEFLSKDNDKIDALIAEHPLGLSIREIADFLGLDVASVRAAVENGVVGLAWRKSGKANHGYFIPTAQFVRWYLKFI